VLALAGPGDNVMQFPRALRPVSLT